MPLWDAYSATPAEQLPLYFDDYCRELATIGKITPEIASAVLARQYSIRSLRATADARLADVRDARIYVITPEAAQCVERTAARLTTVPAFEPPVPKLWLEFESAELIHGEVVNGEVVATDQVRDPDCCDAWAAGWRA